LMTSYLTRNGPQKYSSPISKFKRYIDGSIAVNTDVEEGRLKKGAKRGRAPPSIEFRAETKRKKEGAGSTRGEMWRKAGWCNAGSSMDMPSTHSHRQKIQSGSHLRGICARNATTECDMENPTDFLHLPILGWQRVLTTKESKCKPQSTPPTYVPRLTW
jgi:hypothetical protein